MGPHHERVNALLLVCIHPNIFLDYDKKNRHLCIQISKEDAFSYSFKGELNCCTFNTRKTYKAYIDFGILD